jgi:hypothetical protein
MTEDWDFIASVIGFDPRLLAHIAVDSQRWYRQRDSVHKRLLDLQSLPEGWDGYRGQAVASKTSDRVHALLSACLSPIGQSPTIIPGSSGEVQLEWHQQGVDLEVGVSKKRSIRVWVTSDKTGVEGITQLFRLDYGVQHSSSALTEARKI